MPPWYFCHNSCTFIISKQDWIIPLLDESKSEELKYSSEQIELFDRKYKNAYDILNDQDYII